MRIDRAFQKLTVALLCIVAGVTGVTGKEGLHARLHAQLPQRSQQPSLQQQAAQQQVALRNPPLQEHTASLEVAEFARKGRRLITADSEAIVVWDAQSGEPLERIAQRPRGTRISPTGDLLVYAKPAADVGTLTVRSLQDRTTVQIEASSDSHVSAARFSRDGRFLLIPRIRGDQATLWDVRDGSRVSEIIMPAYDAPQLREARRRMTGPQPHNSEFPLRQLLGWKTGGPDQTRLALDARDAESSFSPTGRHFLSVNWHDTGSSTAQASLWDAETLKLIHVYESPVSATPHIHYLDNATRFLIGASRRSLEVRETATGRLLQTIGPLPETIQLLVVDPQERWAVTLQRDGRLSTWNLDSGEPLAHASIADDELSSDLSRDLPDNMALLGADRLVVPGKTTRIYSLPDLQRKHEISLASTRITASEAGDRFVLHNNSSVRLMDATGQSLRRLMRLPARRLVLSPNGDWALGVKSEHGSPSDAPQLPVVVWETRTGRRLLEFPATSLAFDYSEYTRSPMDRSIAVKVGNRPGTVKLQRRGSHRPLFPVRLQANIRASLTAAGINNAPLRDWLLTFQADDLSTQRRFGTAGPPQTGVQLMNQSGVQLTRTVWNTSPSSRVIAQYRDGSVQHLYTIDDMRPTAATFSSDQSKLVVAFTRGEGRGTVRHAVGVFDTSSGRLLYRLDGTPAEVKHNWDIDSLTLSPDDRYLIVSFDYHDFLVDLQQAREEDRGVQAYVFVGDGYSGLPGRDTASFSSDSTRVVVLGYQRTLWDVTAGRQLAMLGAYNGCWNYVFSPNSRFLYIDGFDGPQLLDARTGEHVHKFEQGVDPIFSADGTLMVPRRWGIAGVHLWNFNEGRKICRLSPRNAATVVHSVFNSSGTRLMILEHSDGDSLCTVYDTTTGDLLAVHRDPGRQLFPHSGTPPYLVGEDRVIVASDQGATMWSFDTATPVHEYPISAPTGRFVCDGDRLLVLGVAAASLWDIRRQQQTPLQHVPHQLTLRPPPRFAPNGDIIALHDRGLSVSVWDATTGALKARHHCINEGVDWFVGWDERR